MDAETTRQIDELRNQTAQALQDGRAAMALATANARAVDSLDHRMTLMEDNVVKGI